MMVLRHGRRYMTIFDFKKGQIIHRTKASSTGDRSFIEEPIEFVAVESGLIFFKMVEEDMPSWKGKIRRMELASRNDDEWDLFPLKYLSTDDDVSQKESAT